MYRGMTSKRYWRFFIIYHLIFFILMAGAWVFMQPLPSFIGNVQGALLSTGIVAAVNRYVDILID